MFRPAATYTPPVYLYIYLYACTAGPFTLRARGFALYAGDIHIPIYNCCAQYILYALLQQIIMPSTRATHCCSVYELSLYAKVFAENEASRLQSRGYMIF